MAAVDKKYARLIAPEDPKIEAWRSLFSLVTDDDPDELDQAVKDLGAQSEDLEVEVMGYGTLLSYAAQNSVDVCAHLLEEHRLNPNTRSSTEKDQTALFDAKGGAVLVLIERGADERLQNSEGETAFTAAVKRGDYTQASQTESREGSCGTGDLWRGEGMLDRNRSGT
uniref:Uncharacterized protein n=1 Tax=Chromera velia CCMP2878 TaxID=1169474 RepID=A0A0G4HKQ8_9ALVE|eukprot:Cvel_7246.t1-p1 / transcript=Cvel_7246.t1 / gene=Cvel_7246 / organism=Chromera_velia_CCMP2878 / gene_product=hypothetical protein / transcript_product=hypothetical protein / location=Cvel_scaffold374:15534-16905(+) / protein_length=167 / sequence_SO=supercontig / SO=protein_coding / is_pseudo=false